MRAWPLLVLFGALVLIGYFVPFASVSGFSSGELVNDVGQGWAVFVPPILAIVGGLVAAAGIEVGFALGAGAVLGWAVTVALIAPALGTAYGISDGGSDTSPGAGAVLIGIAAVVGLLVLAAGVAVLGRSRASATRETMGVSVIGAVAFIVYGASIVRPPFEGADVFIGDAHLNGILVTHLLVVVAGAVALLVTRSAAGAAMAVGALAGPFAYWVLTVFSETHELVLRPWRDVEWGILGLVVGLAAAAFCALALVERVERHPGGTRTVSLETAWVGVAVAAVIGVGGLGSIAAYDEGDVVVAGSGAFDDGSDDFDGGSFEGDGSGSGSVDGSDDIDSLYRRCADWDMQACDDLYNATPVGSSEERFAMECGGYASSASHRGTCAETFDTGD